MKPKYSVYSNFDDVEIRVDFEEDRTSAYWNFEGSFTVFTHAKKLAVQIMQTKVCNFRNDYETAKYNKVKVGNILKSNFK